MVPNIDLIDNIDQVDEDAIPQGFATSVETAQFLGLTRQAISQMALAGIIPAVRFGRALRIPWDWLYEQKQRARKEPPPVFPRKRSARKPARTARAQVER
jgi:hypothetical protein